MVNIRKHRLNSFFAILKNYWFLILIFIVGLIVRIVFLNDTIAISKDQVDHIQWAQEIFKNHGYIWHGARLRGGSESVEVFLGPFYEYLLALPAKIGHGYFLLPTLLNVFLNSVSIFLIYYLAKLITRNKTAGIISAILFAFSTAFVIASRTIWNPWFLPFFTLITFIAFVKLTQGKEKFLVIFILFLSFCTQLHASALLFVPIFLILWLVFRIKIKQKILWLYSLLALTLSYLPMIYYELTHHFVNFRNLLQVTLHPAQNGMEKFVFFPRFINSVKKFTESFSISLDGRVYESAWGEALWFGHHFEKLLRYSAGATFLFICLFFLVNILRKNYREWRKNLLLIPLVAIFIFLIGSIFFSYELFVYYFATILPLAYVIIAYVLAQAQRNTAGKIAVIGLLIVFSWINLNSFYFYVRARQNRASASASELMNPDMILKDQIELLGFVKNDSLNQGVQFDYWLNFGPVNSASQETYRYLINLMNIKIKEHDDIVYLIVDPRIKPLDNRLKGKQVFTDRIFGSLRLIKYQN